MVVNKIIANIKGTGDTFDDLFATSFQLLFDIEFYCFGGNPLAHPCTLLIPFWSFWAPFWLNVNRFWYLLNPFCFLFVSIPFLSASEAAKHLQDTLFERTLRSKATCGAFPKATYAPTPKFLIIAQPAIVCTGFKFLSRAAKTFLVSPGDAD